MKIKESIREWLIECEIKNYTQKTRRSYRNNIELWARWAESEAGVRDCEDISPALVKRFMLYGARKKWRGSYTNSILKVLKSFVNYIYSEGFGGFDTRHSFIWAKQDKAVVNGFSPAQVKTLLRNCSGNDYIRVRDRAILTTLLDTGIRCWELCCISKEDVHSDYILITHGKNHKSRAVPITPPMQKALMRYERARDAYFEWRVIHDKDAYFLSGHGRQLTNSAVEHVIKSYAQGIEGVRISPHTCRHTFAQRQLTMGTDVYTISRLLGHESIAITQTYLRSLSDHDIVMQARQKSVIGSL